MRVNRKEARQVAGKALIYEGREPYFGAVSTALIETGEILTLDLIDILTDVLVAAGAELPEGDASWVAPKGVADLCREALFRWHWDGESRPFPTPRSLAKLLGVTLEDIWAIINSGVCTLTVDGISEWWIAEGVLSSVGVWDISEAVAILRAEEELLMDICASHTHTPRATATEILIREGAEAVFGSRIYAELVAGQVSTDQLVYWLATAIAEDNQNRRATTSLRDADDLAEVFIIARCNLSWWLRLKGSAA